jgi:hypothetical protein
MNHSGTNRNTLPRPRPRQCVGSSIGEPKSRSVAGYCIHSDEQSELELGSPVASRMPGGHLYLDFETLDFETLDFETLDFETLDFETLYVIYLKVDIAQVWKVCASTLYDAASLVCGPFADEVKWCSRYSRMCGHMAVSHPFLEIFLTAADRGIAPGHLTTPASAYKRYSLVLDPWALSRAGALHRTIYKMNQPASRSRGRDHKGAGALLFDFETATAIYHSAHLTKRRQSTTRSMPRKNCRTLSSLL